MGGSNGFRGHLIMGSVGFLVVATDVLWFRRLPSVEAMIGFSAFVVFPPLLLSAQGMDKETEELPLFILTFATSSVFGIFVGMIVLTNVTSNDMQSVQTISTVWTLATGIAVCVSYWTVGQMSRNQVAAIVAVYADLPPNTKAFLCLLQLERYHGRTRTLVEALMTHRHRAVLFDGGLLDQAVVKVCEGRDQEEVAEIHTLAGEVREEIRAWATRMAVGDGGTRSAMKHLTRTGVRG